MPYNDLGFYLFQFNWQFNWLKYLRNVGSNDLFSAIIDTQSKISVLGIPLTNYDSAPIRCEIRPEQGLWVITKMFIE